MSRLYVPALALVLASLGQPAAAQQEATGSPSAPGDSQLRVCSYIEGKMFQRTSELSCGVDGNATLAQLHEQGWKVKHYSVSAKGSALYHYLILEL